MQICASICSCQYRCRQSGPKESWADSSFDDAIVPWSWPWFMKHIGSVLGGTSFSLQWRHNKLDGVSNHRLHDCLLNSLFRRRSKKTAKLRVTGLYEGNSPVTGEFTAQRASNAENVSIWWRHHVKDVCHWHCSRFHVWKKTNNSSSILTSSSQSIGHTNKTCCLTWQPWLRLLHRYLLIYIYSNSYNRITWQ